MISKLLSILESKKLMPERERLRKEYKAKDFTGGKTGTLFFASIAFVLLAIAVHLTVIQAQDYEIKDYERLLEELKVDIEKGNEKESDHKRLTSTVDSLISFKEALPGREAVTPIINDIHNAAKDNGLSIESVKYGGSAPKESIIGTHTMSFPLEGGYKAIKKFLYDIESLKHHLVIDKFSVTSTTKGRIAINLTIAIYIKGEGFSEVQSGT